jgi:hypothetical protein
MILRGYETNLGPGTIRDSEDSIDLGPTFRSSKRAIP